MTQAPEKLTARQEDIDAVNEAVVDYVEGYYKRDPEQTARAYHPECLKRIFEVDDDGTSYLVTLTDQAMIERAHLSHLRVDDPVYEIVIDGVSEDIATVRLYSESWVDYLHVVRARGEWKLLHASSTARQPEPPRPFQDDIEGVTGAAMDYIEAWFQGDAERHARAYHSECAKRAYFIDPETGKDTLKTLTPQEMVDYCATGLQKVDDCAIEVVIDEIYHDVATVRVYSCNYVDFLHITKARGEWKLLHVTWHRRSG